MFFSGLMVYRVYDALGDKAGHFVSMARETLGSVVASITWVAFALLLYALMVLYLSGGRDLTLGLLGHEAHGYESMLISGVWMLVGLGLVCFGAYWVDRINRWFMIILLASFLLMLFVMLPFMQAGHRYETHLSAWLPALPFLITAFGFQVIVPTLCRYLDGSGASMFRVLLFGSVLALLIYTAWIYAVYAVAPMQGDAALSTVLSDKMTLARFPGLMASWMGGDKVAQFIDAFIFSGIVTSFFGISLGLYHFFRDAFKTFSFLGGRLFCLAITFVVPLLMALSGQHVFMSALRYAGFFVAVLNGFLPCAMFFAVRKQVIKGSFALDCFVFWLPLLYTFFYALLVVLVDLWMI